MGHAVEEQALERGHHICCRIDTAADMERLLPELKRADVAVEFSTPATAVANIEACLEAGVPVVCGTTGWYDRYEQVAARCRDCGGALLTATNFSVGMNIMFALSERLASLMRGRTDYKASIREVHHIHKLDAPSGTAITLQGLLAEQGGMQKADIPIESVREGEVPGIHTVRYDSEIDSISLTHEAHGRKGLAQGATLAAEWLAGRQGVFTMKDMLSL